MPSAENYRLATVEVGAPGAGEVQVRNHWMSLDPAMRGRMYDRKSYVPPFELDKAMEGGAVGEVMASNHDGFAVGDAVYSRFGWREVFNAPADAIEKIEPSGLPSRAYLGIAGMPGLTAYVGLIRIAALKPDDVVFVSSAAGAVGSIACQIAKLKGHKVIGSAGGEAKLSFLKNDLGLDEAIDYKNVPSLAKALKSAAPEGIDVYFDNVGGEHLEAAISVANRSARFALCGMISTYNATGPVPGPHNIMLAMPKCLRLEGFIARFHLDLMAEYRAQLAAWHAAGRLKWKETVFDGLESAPDALMALFEGRNLGKMLVKL